MQGEQDARVAIAVHNEGRPIPPAVQAHIFEPFRKGPRRSQADGLGLRLFMTCEIARAHGGRLAVESTEARGTTFRLELPRHPAPPNAR